ncbi:MAG: CDP-2,3-bis-(O-geranylgeranyl)-sn-glycerol synthase [Methanoculleaceae archaeon]
MIPAYIPNSAAAVFGGGAPLDGGRCFSDGRRILGDGKTVRGFLGGAASGICAGIALMGIRSVTGWECLPPHTFVTVTLLAVGALLGDLIKSFLKRRAGKDRGEKWPVADQYDLVVGSIVLLLIGEPGWVISYITPIIIIWILVITPLLHRGVNIIGYLMGVKNVPW